MPYVLLGVAFSLSHRISYEILHPQPTWWPTYMLTKYVCIDSVNGFLAHSFVYFVLSNPVKFGTHISILPVLRCCPFMPIPTDHFFMWDIFYYTIRFIFFHFLWKYRGLASSGNVFFLISSILHVGRFNLAYINVEKSEFSEFTILICHFILNKYQLLAIIIFIP